MVSVAKAKAGRASTLAVQEGVQMHGGIGMTDEYDIGLYMKRDRAAERAVRRSQLPRRQAGADEGILRRLGTRERSGHSAKAGIQSGDAALDSRFRGNDVN